MTPVIISLGYSIVQYHPRYLIVGIVGCFQKQKRYLTGGLLAPPYKPGVWTWMDCPLIL